MADSPSIVAVFGILVSILVIVSSITFIAITFFGIRRDRRHALGRMAEQEQRQREDGHAPSPLYAKFVQEEEQRGRIRQILEGPSMFEMFPQAPAIVDNVH
ncbi:hypothetical protein SCUCBS95973_001495 [Sporothrix curviconia]|uniref:Uncharacterized protein n=1 Tax=Sporothrix curviconia TaxID=1260050 RepID=A0ABP0AZ31_9PEZI